MRRISPIALALVVALLAVSFGTYQALAASYSFSNSSGITINDATGNANNCPNTPQPSSPNPSTINVSGVVGSISKVTVTVTGLSHNFPGDIDMMLVGPGGQNIVLMSDVGRGNDISNINITFDDGAANSLPTSNTTITSGSYKPTNANATNGSCSQDSFPSPAPTPSANTTLAAFNSLSGANVNGAWRLFVTDDTNQVSGSISGGWSLNITTVDPPTAVNDAYTTAFNTQLVVNAPGVLANDTNPPGASAPFVNGGSSPTNGTLSLGADGSFIYTPTNGFAGTDSFTYRAANNAGNSNLATVTITVQKGNQTITFANPGTRTYGDAPFALGATASSGLPVSYTVVSGPATVDAGGTLTITGAGSVTVRASQAGNSTYNAAPDVEQTFTVAKAALTISADNKTKKVDTPNPTLTASYSGFVNGEDASVLDTAVSLSTTATTNSPVGTYPIVASGAADANYTITFVDGTLTVSAKDVPVITWANPADITYGTELDGSQLNATASFNNNPVAGSFSYSPAAGALLNAGAHTLAVTFTPDDTATYAPVQGSVSISVLPAPLSVTVDNKSKVYGDPLPALTYSVSGFVNNETESVLDTAIALSTAATASSGVGSYAITTTAGDGNYTISFTDGTLTVTAAPLTISADNKVKKVGTANPLLTASYSGLVNGDSVADLDTVVSLSTTATDASPVGDYPIVASGAADANYTITFVDGTLTVSAKDVPVITWADPANITYGTALSATQLNATVAFNGNPVTGTLTYSPTLGALLNVGNSQQLSVTFTPDDSATYASVQASTSINVLPAALSVTVADATKAYGAALPTFTYSITGFVNGEDESVLDTPVALDTIATANSSVGSYAITATAGDSNYTISFTDGTLTITPVALTITADNKVKRVGTANPQLTASYSGFVNGDTTNDLDTPVSLSTTATDSSPAGDYPIVASGAADANYTITFVDGTLTVADKLVPTITWATPSAIVYGTALGNGQLNATATINGTPVVGTLAYSPAAGTLLNAGNGQQLSVTFTPEDTTSYATATATVQIDVLKAALTITADNKSMTVGGPLPTLTATYSGFVNGDDAGDLDIPVQLNTAATSTSPAGSYPIVAAAAQDANYSITFVNGTLTVGSAPTTTYRLMLPIVRK